MCDLQFCKLNSELLNIIKDQSLLGIESIKGSKVSFIYTYSPSFIKSIVDTRYSKCFEITRNIQIKLCINLKDVGKDILLELSKLNGFKGVSHIHLISPEETVNLKAVCKSEYLFRNEDSFYLVA